MNFDPEGHLCISPAEIDAMVRRDIPRLIDDTLIPGTPFAFDTYAAYREFLAFVAGELSVHPSSLVFRGSTKIGFSIAPDPAKVWGAMRPTSDIDLAVVDPDHYHFLDAEVRRDERSHSSFKRKDHVKRRNLLSTRSYYCYRHMDLPDTSIVLSYRSAMDRASAPDQPGCNRPVSAFFFRDWWSLRSRYEFDLRRLRKGLSSGLPAGPDVARPRT